MIGVMDSGVGGLSVLREILSQLPHHATLYFADQAHVPYGPRPISEVRDFATGIVRFLIESGADVVVVACNTASAAALHHLRAAFRNTPIVGMEPAVKPAAERTRTGIIGVIATQATFQGKLFASLLDRFATGIDVRTQACPELVLAVENGKLDDPETDALIRRYLGPLVDAGIDQLVLGCTHFPFLAPAMRRFLGPEITIVDPSAAVARQTGRVLSKNGIKGEGEGARLSCFTTGPVERFAAQFEQLMGFGCEVKEARWEGGKVVSG